MNSKNIRLKIKHRLHYDKEDISEKLKEVDYLFDEITIRSLSCVFKNEEKEYHVSVNRHSITFEFNYWENSNIVMIVLRALRLLESSQDIQVTIVENMNYMANNFNKLFKHIPEGVSTEFLGFKYDIENVNYYTSLFINLDQKASYRIGFHLSTIPLDEIDIILEDQINRVDKEILPIIDKFIEEVL